MNIADHVNPLLAELLGRENAPFAYAVSRLTLPLW